MESTQDQINQINNRRINAALGGLLTGTVTGPGVNGKVKKKQFISLKRPAVSGGCMKKIEAKLKPLGVTRITDYPQNELSPYYHWRYSPADGAAPVDFKNITPDGLAQMVDDYLRLGGDGANIVKRAQEIIAALPVSEIAGAVALSAAESLDITKPVGKNTVFVTKTIAELSAALKKVKAQKTLVIKGRRDSVYDAGNPSRNGGPSPENTAVASTGLALSASLAQGLAQSMSDLTGLPVALTDNQGVTTKAGFPTKAAITRSEDETKMMVNETVESRTSEPPGGEINDLAKAAKKAATEEKEEMHTAEVAMPKDETAGPVAPTIKANAEKLAALANQIKEKHKKVEGAHTAVIEHQLSKLEFAKECGEFLKQAKALVPHGKWEAWVEKHCEFSPRTARVYMQVVDEWKTVMDHWEKRQTSAALSIESMLGVGRQGTQKPIQKPKKPTNRKAPISGVTARLPGGAEVPPDVLQKLLDAQKKEQSDVQPITTTDGTAQDANEEDTPETAPSDKSVQFDVPPFDNTTNGPHPTAIIFKIRELHRVLEKIKIGTWTDQNKITIHDGLNDLMEAWTALAK